MADRTALRLAVDLGFAAAVVACGIAAYVMSATSPAPPGVCAATTGGPRYGELLADGQITIAAVIGELAGGAIDHNAWSARALVTALRERGFVEIAPDRYAADGLIVDVSLVRQSKKAIGHALEHALATHEVVYFTGHSYRGKLAFTLPEAYRIVMLDACWTTQLYSRRLVGPERDVISNRERAITGSIESFLVLVDGLRARADAYQPLLADMNRRAARRARFRAPSSHFKNAEDYRLDVACAR